MRLSSICGWLHFGVYLDGESVGLVPIGIFEGRKTDGASLLLLDGLLSPCDGISRSPNEVTFAGVGNSVG